MLHAAPRARRGTVLFHTWAEARLLWDAIVGRVPHVQVLLLMPDHVHARVTPGQWRGLQRAMAAYAQARNRRRGEWGPVWEHHHRPTVIGEGQKERRTDRYILLNPCRAGLTADPLSWAFSTLRDTVGLAAPPVRPTAHDPWRLMSYLAHDDHVAPGMDELPTGLGRPARLDELEVAVSAFTRTTLDALRRRGPARSLFIRSARALTTASAVEIAAFIGVSERTVRGSPAGVDAVVRRVSRILGSSRLPALGDDDLRRTPSWRRYRGRR